MKNVDISNKNIQARRSQMLVPCGRKGVVHDYVPFY
ncbi:DarT ssDNA thymidine ADP-ribosyltransferase family protein, partial [Citrobacter freundii]